MWAAGRFSRRAPDSRNCPIEQRGSEWNPEREPHVYRVVTREGFEFIGRIPMYNCFARSRLTLVLRTSLSNPFVLKETDGISSGISRSRG